MRDDLRHDLGHERCPGGDPRAVLRGQRGRAGLPGDDSNVVGYVAAIPGARYIATQLGAKSNVGRNSFYSPGFGIWNLAVFKNTHFTENTYLQLRVEMYNAFNHPNYTVAGALSVFSTFTATNALADPAYNLANGNPDFLNPKVFSGGSRNLQLVAKIVF